MRAWDMLAMVVVVVGLTRGVAADLKWSQVKPAAGSPVPLPRQEAVMGYDEANNRLILFGGKTDNDIHVQETWVFDLDTYVWSQTPTPADLTPRRDPGSASFQSSKQMIITHGIGESGLFDDTWSLSFDTYTWTELKPTGPKPEPRYGGSQGPVDAKNFYLYSHGFGSARYSDSYKLDLTTNSWEKIHGSVSQFTPFEPHARCLVAGTVAGNEKLAMFGGCARGGKAMGPCPGNDAWVMDTERASWSQATRSPTPRNHGIMVQFPGQSNLVIMYGGQEVTKQVIAAARAGPDEIDILNVDTGDWSRRSAQTPPSESRWGQAMTHTATVVFMFGGNTGSELKNDLWMLEVTNYDAADVIPGDGAYLSLIIIHAVLMVASWGVLLQVGAFIARYFRYRDPWWFKMHRRYQIAGVVLQFIGVIFGIAGGHPSNLGRSHGLIGIITVLFGLAQPLNAYFRPHPDTPNRWKFNYLHWTLGRSALILGMVNISLGIYLFVSPVWVQAIWFTWFGLLIVAYIVYEVRRRKGWDLQSSPRKVESNGSINENEMEDMGDKESEKPSDEKVDMKSSI